jgi:quaternary ammonium compound-resistance protein SugE
LADSEAKQQFLPKRRRFGRGFVPLEIGARCARNGRERRQPAVQHAPRLIDNVAHFIDGLKGNIVSWLLLTVAGILEVAFAFGMKSSQGFTRLAPSLFAAATGLSSIYLLSVSVRTLPIGTAYAVWTGIGAAGTALIGMALLGDSSSPARIACIMLILFGVIGLRFAGGG